MFSQEDPRRKYNQHRMDVVRHKGFPESTNKNRGCPVIVGFQINMESFLA